jgi:hypothetical protein
VTTGKSRIRGNGSCASRASRAIALLSVQRNDLSADAETVPDHQHAFSMPFLRQGLTSATDQANRKKGISKVFAFRTRSRRNFKSGACRVEPSARPDLTNHRYSKKARFLGPSCGVFGRGERI